MSKIVFLPSMVLDVICLIQKASLGRCNKEQRMNPDQISEVKNLRAQLPPDFANECLGMSTLSSIISTATDNELEQCSLDDLIEIFKNADSLVSTVKERTADGFGASTVHAMLNWIENGFAEKYIDKLEQLKAIGFEEQYRQRVLPLVEREIEKNQSRIADYNYEELFERIAKMKGCEKIDNAKIFISFFSYPTAFALYKGAYLTCFSSGNPDIYKLTAHELMHGFADNELTDMYLQYMASDAYLCEMHRRLIEDMRSGDEEEFTTAAEYYLCLLSGKYEKSSLLAQAKKKYGGCCPIAVIIFDMLSKEVTVPADYNAWLKRQFINKTLPTKNIKEFVENIG